ncbi:hypothetical protein U1Q18_050260, partial [Sarracenia purpurea var. burkii]
AKMQARVLNSAKGNKHTNFITLAVLDFIATKRAAFSYENDQQSNRYGRKSSAVFLAPFFALSQSQNGNSCA